MDQSRDDSDLTGRQVSHFRVLEPLGAGGMGVVYRAEDLKLHRTVALKFMRPDYTLDETAAARFLREARSVATLDHPNICTVHEVGESEDGRLFLAMSYYTGQTLRDRLTARGPLPVADALDIATQIARGLACAHAAGIVHRDLKPANVMLTADGTVKILDFGLAKSRDQTMTATGAVMGTVAYMSPEQLVGDPVDARSDLWSLGVVLFEMLTGRHPSRSDDVSGTLTRNLATAAVPVRPEASDALAQLLERLLRREPDERYQSANELIGDLGALREQVTTRVAAPAATGARFARREVVISGVVLALAAALFVAVQWRPARLPADDLGPATNGHHPAASVGVLPLKNFAGADQEYFAEGMTDELTTTLGKIEALRVIAYQSMLQFKGSAEPIPAIARRVRVNYVVDGSVRSDSSRVRVNARLVDAARDSVIWTRDFDEARRDVMTLQRNVAVAIARAIAGTLTPQDQARLANPKKVDPIAYELYVKGTRARYDANFTGDFRESTRLFEASIKRDTMFAEPYAGLAFNYAWVLDYEQARQMADKAIDLDPRLADAYVARSIIKQFFEWDWKGAEAALLEAIELVPGHAEAHHELSMLWSRLGHHDKALSEALTALNYNPFSMRFENGVGEIYAFGGDSEKALQVADELARRDSTFLGSYFVRNVAYLQLGRYDDAQEAWLRCDQINPGGCSFTGDLAYIYAKNGHRADALKAIDSLRMRWRETRANRSAWDVAERIAAAYAGLGERDSAVTWLDSAATLHTQMLYVKVHPTFASLRSHPRYQKLLEKMGFPED